MGQGLSASPIEKPVFSPTQNRGLRAILIGIDGIADPVRRSGIGDPEGDGQEVRRFSTRPGCLVEKS
jgi:hypothetical protein